jgi:hypothetical protein
VHSLQTGVVRSDVDADGTGVPDGYVGSADSLEYPSLRALVEALGDIDVDEDIDVDGEADFVVLGVGEGEADTVVLAVESPPNGAATFLARSFLPLKSVLTSVATTLTKVIPL